jgi:hypothetical protein
MTKPFSENKMVEFVLKFCLCATPEPITSGDVVEPDRVCNAMGELKLLLDETFLLTPASIHAYWSV